MDEPKRNRRARRRSLAILLAPIAALAGVLALLGAGVAPPRLRPVAIDLAFSAVASILYFAITYVSRRRARRLRGTEVPWGVRLRKPIWLSTPEMTVPLELGGLLAALVALVGFPGIGAGVLVTFLVIASMMPLFAFGMSPRALIFEQEGLRVELRHAAFVVPWASLTRIESVGPEHMNMTIVGLADTEAIVATTIPATTEARARVATAIADVANHGRVLMLMSWTGGLDGRTLRRFIDAARSGAGRHVN